MLQIKWFGVLGVEVGWGGEKERVEDDSSWAAESVLVLEAGSIAQALEVVLLGLWALPFHIGC